ncbi:MAG: glutamate synthase-related protein [Microthrixaceae bacterium]
MQVAERTPGVLRCGLADRVRRASRRAHGTAGRHQVRGRRSGLLHRSGRADAGHGRRPGLRHRRRWRGGTGAAPLVFADHVSLPFLRGFPEVYRAFAREGLADDIVFVGSGRLGLPHRGLAAMALGCDLLAVARETMLTVGCIQAQRCHTGNCPTGVATQRPSRERGLVVSDKAPKVARYIATLRQDLLRLARACGEPHPGFVHSGQVAVLSDPRTTIDLTTLAGYDAPTWGRPGEDQRAALAACWSPMGVQPTGPGHDAGSDAG